MVFLHAVQEHVARDPEQAGCLGTVAAAHGQGLAHQVFFHLLQRDSAGWQPEEFTGTIIGRRQEHVRGLDAVGAAQDQAPFHHVLQLADVAGPLVPLELGHGLGAELHASRGLVPVQEVAHQGGNILDPLAQGRQVQGDDRDPVEEVFPEAPPTDVLLQVAVGRGDDPDVDLLLAVTAHRLHPALLQNAQELDLHLGQQLTDLVQEQGALVRGLEPALAVPDRAGKGPLDMAEQLAFDQAVRDGRAVDRDKGFAGALAAGVDEPGQDLLAGPRLAGDEHGCPRFRHLEGRVQQLGHGRVDGLHAFDTGKAVDLLGKGPRPAAQAAQLQGLAAGKPQGLAVKGFADKGEGPLLHGLDRHLDGAVGRDHDHRQVGFPVLEPLQQLQAVHVAELDIGDHQVRGFPLETGHRFPATGSGRDPEAALLQVVLGHPAQGRVVVDEQNVVQCSSSSWFRPSQPCSGRRTVKRAPPRGESSTEIRPPQLSMIRLEMASPRPVPSLRVE